MGSHLNHECRSDDTFFSREEEEEEDRKGSQDGIAADDPGNVTMCDLGLVHAPPPPVGWPRPSTRGALAGIRATVPLGNTEVAAPVRPVVRGQGQTGP